jgi:hypothetical protein
METETVGPIGQTVTAATVPTIYCGAGNGNGNGKTAG